MRWKYQNIKRSRNEFTLSSIQMQHRDFFIWNRRWIFITIYELNHREKKDLQLWILFDYQYRVLKNCNNRVDYRHIYEKASVIYIRDFFIKSQIIKQIKKQKTQLKAVFLWSMEIYYSSKFQLVKGLPSLSSKEPQAIIIISMIVPIPKRPPVKSHNIPVPIFPT